MSVKLEPSWLEILKEEFNQDYMIRLRNFLIEEKEKGYAVYPQNSEIFSAFAHTPFDKVKVVILGQDPYHGPGQAHGLSFSVPKNIPVPASLVNIYKEIKNDLGYEIPKHGNLTHWADQGVLLLNAVLTVRAKSPGCHQGKGWELFTDKAISALSEQREHIVFLLWGNYAKNKVPLIDAQKHLILTAAHPSPYSVSGFSGCRHFSLSNRYLESKGIKPVDWQIL